MIKRKNQETKTKESIGKKEARKKECERKEISLILTNGMKYIISDSMMQIVKSGLSLLLITCNPIKSANTFARLRQICCE